ncbi:hypothetical protein [Thalassoglobus polymorphus]|uniref:Uncharacterized protein n=1 Tax=Thalassoglobus polymorphus TaxID=2527994 RepID=A0A517QR60_9PLAN|nr:hypothetical protein [Thalassoglobus polymorphus]QDT34114.1 hypothetical protein Mal48_33740 [Thalassoglobus polymorphus]
MNTASDQNRPQVNRLLVGIIAILCLIAGAIISLNYPEESFWGGSFVRVGLLMAAFWYAAPTKGRAAAWANVSPWMIVGVAALLLLIVRRPRILIPFGVALFVLGFIVPKLLGKPRKQ